MSEVTREFEDALCELCLTIQRQDRKVGVESADSAKAPFAWLTATLPEIDKTR